MFIQGKESEGPETIALFAAISAFVSRYIIFAESYELQTSKTSSKGRIHIKGLFASGFIILGIGITFLPGRSLGIADSLAAVLLSIYLLWTSGRLLYKAADELIEASLDEETNRKIREIINETEGVTGSRELKTRRIGKGIAINACHHRTQLPEYSRNFRDHKPC